MDQRIFEVWRKALLGVCGFMALFGVALMFSGTSLIPGFDERVSQVLWGQAVMPDEVVVYHRFLHAVLGATVLGWSVTMGFVVQHAFRRREAWAWWALFAGPVLWFVFDCGASLYYGVWPNALLNLASALGLLTPVLVTRRAFASSARAGAARV